MYMHIYLYIERELVGQFVWLSTLSFVQEVSWSIVQDGQLLLCVLFDIPTRLVLYIVSTSLQWAPLEMWKIEQVYIGYIQKVKVSWVSCSSWLNFVVSFIRCSYQIGIVSCINKFTVGSIGNVEKLTSLHWVLFGMQKCHGFHWKCGKVNKFTLGIILNAKVSWSFFKTHFHLLGVDFTVTQVSFLKINFRKYRTVEKIWRK